jgi:hypothetical protein
MNLKFTVYSFSSGMQNTASFADEAGSLSFETTFHSDGIL